ncbi:MAG: hypothetical protein ACTJHU_04680 [Mycetocola sp.]
MMPATPRPLTRVFLTWLAIFPLVTLASLLLRPLTDGLPFVLQIAVMTAIVVPIAVLVVMPLLFRLRGALLMRRTPRA